jgi:pantoate--beta-alanine ligase
VDIVHTISDFAAIRQDWAKNGWRVGFVPTMGALHQGHLSLVDQIKPNVDRVVTSIFVNPKQFGPNEDFGKYPRTFAEDKAMLEEKKVDLVFMPSAEEFYPPDFSSSITNLKYSTVLCGAFRPGHFDGVLTVVMKLFNVVKPDVAIFGKKDFQQLQLIKAMVRDFFMDIRILEGPIVRESSGLAMSSRNRYLTEAQKEEASALYKSLTEIKKRVAKSVRRKSELLAAASEVISEQRSLSVEYLELRKPTLEPFGDEIQLPAVALVAAKLGSVRLIDCLEIHE